MFRLHGHHFRLLDRARRRLEATLSFTRWQSSRDKTQRIAFAAEHAGHWLIESVATGRTALYERMPVD